MPVRIDHRLVFDEVQRLCSQGAWVTAERVARSLGRLDDGPDLAESVRAVLDALVDAGELQRNVSEASRQRSRALGEPRVIAYRPGDYSS